MRQETWGTRCVTGAERQEPWDWSREREFMRQEKGDMRQEMWHRRRETWDMRQETGDRRQETWVRRQEAWDKRHEIWYKICETGDMIQNTWYKREDTRDSCHSFPQLTTNHSNTQHFSNRNVCYRSQRKSVLSVIIYHKHVSERFWNILTLPGGKNDFSNSETELYLEG